jgi:hypothetical protein
VQQGSLCVVLPSSRGLGTYYDQIWSTVLKHEVPLCKGVRKKGGSLKARNVFSNPTATEVALVSDAIELYNRCLKPTDCEHCDKMRGKGNDKLL